MSNIRNPFVFSPTGQAVPVGAPPLLRVVEGRATPEQLDMAQKVFHQFCSRTRLSVVPNPREGGRLPDGSRYEINVVGAVQTMLLWPAGTDGVGPFIAWTAFFTSSYLPIWDRPLVDFPYDDLPPRPEPPGPAPEYPALAEHYSRWDVEGQEVSGSVTVYIIYRLYIGWRVLGSGEPDTEVLAGFLRRTRLDEDTGYTLHEYVNAPQSPGFAWSITARSFDPNGLTPMGDDGGYANFPSIESPPVEVFPSYTPYQAWIDAAQADANAYNITAVAEWESAHADWEAAQAQYLIDLAAWQAERDELLALQRPWWPVNDARNSARPAQIAAVKSYLQGGIGDRHLTARILSFPYNVAYSTIPPAGSGGTITNEAVATDTLLGFKTDLVDAEPFTTIPRWDDGPNEMYPERPLRVDFMPPECLFGWKASGSIQFGYRFYAENPRSEHYVLMPPGLTDVAVSQIPEYFINTRIKPDTAPGLVVASDAFVPVGSTITVVFFEYRVADPHTGTVYWTECPDLMQHDSIWIRDRGVYIDTPRAVDPLFTERVRLAGAITQSRASWGTWSAPVVTPRQTLVQGGWEARYVAAVEYERPAKAPAAVVLANNMHRGANPGPNQSGGFPFGAKFLWSGAPDLVRAARARTWDSNGATAHQEQFIARALIATGRIKP
jgi:hypothetical protein